MRLTGLDPVDEQADRRRLRDRGADLGDDLDVLAEAGRGRAGRALDEHLVARPEPDLSGLDADPARRRQRGLGLARPRRVVAVREQDDPFLRVVGEQRGRESQRATDVAGRTDRRRGDPVDLGEVARQALDQRLLAERDDAGDVAFGHLLERTAHERERVLAPGAPDRVGQVDDEHRRQAVDREHDLQPGETEDERREQHRAEDERDTPPPGADAASRGDVEDHRQEERRDEQQERERRFERDAHLGAPAGRATEPRREPAPDAGQLRRGDRRPTRRTAR